jgi:hypothetical protein
MAKVGASLSGKSQSTVLLPLFLRAACNVGSPPVSAGSPKGVSVKLQSLETTTVEESSELVGTLEAEKRLIWRPETNGRVIRFWILDFGALGSGGNLRNRKRPGFGIDATDKSMRTKLRKRPSAKVNAARVSLS